MTRLELLNQLLDDVNALRYEDDDTDVFNKTELYIQKCFGDESKYMQKFKNLLFVPMVVTSNTTDEDYRRAYELGKKQLVGIVKSMIEDLTLSLDDNESKEIVQEKLGNVFVVHGHDTILRDAVELFLLRMGYNPIILCQEPSRGNTIIEKIEEYTKNICYAIVLYTPCDLGKGKDEEDLKQRARQNVVFEHGYLQAKYGRDHVCALMREGVELPGDFSGVIYVNYDDKNQPWKNRIAKEMEAVGLKIQWSKI